MANPQEKNVPDAHYERLRRHPHRLTMQAWRERLVRRPKTDLAVEAATLLTEERTHRGMEIG